MKGYNPTDIIMHDGDYGKIEMKVFHAILTPCLCTHLFLKHRLEQSGKCEECSCKGYGATNLDWLVKNGNK